jgi:hypothetical protein
VKAKAVDEPARKRRRGGSRSGRKITRLPLTTLSGLIKEAGAVYRRMKVGKLDHEQGRSLVRVLAQMRAMLEAAALERMEKRLEELTEAARYARPLQLEHAGTMKNAIDRIGVRIEALAERLGRGRRSRSVLLIQFEDETDEVFLARHPECRGPEGRCVPMTTVLFE